MLEQELGIEIETFAFPFGYHNRAARAAVKNAGYTRAFAVDDRVVSAIDTPFSIPRHTVAAGTSVPELAGILARRQSLARVGVVEAKRFVWRGVRRVMRDNPRPDSVRT